MPKAFFVMKSHSLKKAKLDIYGTFQQRSSIVVEASYEIAMLIAKNKKSHNIGKSFVNSCIIVAADDGGHKTDNFCSKEMQYQNG